jgi:FkbM family methyltransferase
VTQRISYAQNGEDVRAWRALRHVENGFYVEVGASHPYDHSLTAALSAEGWRGILVEPEPAAAELLRAARPRDLVVGAAASERAGLLTWVNDGDRGEGHVEEGRDGLAVPAVRLSDVLDGAGVAEVHFMSVDVEGHERQALLGLDLARWRPWVLCVEATAPLTRTPTHAAWEPILLDAGFHFVAFDGLNRWYVAAEHRDLTKAVAEPFGVLDTMLDGWERRDVVDLSVQLVEVQAEVTQAGRELELAEAQRDAAMARERVMLESKSWRLTRPLRRVRSSADTALARRALAHPTPEPPPAPRVDSPADLRRRRALQAKLSAAVGRRR